MTLEEEEEKQTEEEEGDEEEEEEEELEKWSRVIGRPVLIGWSVQFPPGPAPLGFCWMPPQLPTSLQSDHLETEPEHLETER